MTQTARPEVPAVRFLRAATMPFVVPSRAQGLGGGSDRSVRPPLCEVMDLSLGPGLDDLDRAAPPGSSVVSRLSRDAGILSRPHMVCMGGPT